MKRKFLSIAILLLTLLGCTWAQSNKSLPGNFSPSEKIEAGTPAGNGTAGHPFEIATSSDLIWLSGHEEYWNSYFIQTADIDISASREWNNGDGFDPIGKSSRSFSGHYNGKGHTINGLYIHRISGTNIGFFGLLITAEIDSLGITNCEVTGDLSVGGLVGNNFAESSIRHCYAEGNITGSGRVGGLVGSNAMESRLSYCFFVGNVKGSQSSGGLAGENISSQISNCYSTGNVICNNISGGLVGSNQMLSSIEDCYASGKVTGLADMSCGAIVGDNSSSSTVENCYWNPTSAGQTQAIGYDGSDSQSSCTALYTNRMKQQESFCGWDFVNTWGIMENQSYPALKCLKNNAPFAFPDTIFRLRPVISLVPLLSNDYDFETGQHSLAYQILGVSSGGFHGDSLYLPGSMVINDTIIIAYRAGELQAERDTLWGNTATSLLIIRNSIPELKAVTNISIPEDSKLVLTLNDITVTDPDSQELSILLKDGMNFTLSGDTIFPYADFNGLLSVNIAVSDGMDTSNTRTMLVNVMAVNDAPAVHDTITTTGENTLLEVNVYAADKDGTIRSLSIDRDPQYGTAKFEGTAITYNPRKDFTGEDTLTWYATDDKGLTSKSAVMAIKVIPANPTPIIELPDREIILYPNPCPGAFYIDAGHTGIQLYLYDLNGKEVFTKWVQDLTFVDISRLSGGAYILRINGKYLRLVRK